MKSEMTDEKVLDLLMGIQKDVATLVERTHDMDNIEKMATEAENRSIKNQEEIERIKESNRWAWRTAIGAFITGAIGILTAWIGG